MAALVVTCFAVALTVGSVARVSPPRTGLQLADMGMGADGPQLGGSQNDMVVDDPGHLPRQPDMITGDPGHEPAEAGMVVTDPGSMLPPAPDMVVTDPGFVPPPAQMDVGTPRDDDRQDDIE
jgi:hypothetical protein